MSLFVGIDIGGTSVRIAFFNDQLEIVHRCRPIMMAAVQTGDGLVEAIRKSLADEAVLAGATYESIVAVGAGCPGPLDLDSGQVLETPNIPFLHHYPIREKLQDALGCPVGLDNDANVYALGEAMAGAGKGAPFLLAVTLGTGFGWGIVLDGKVHRGATGTAAEYGLATIGPGEETWEDTISARGLVNIYKSLGGVAESPLEIAKAAKKGDENALGAWNKFGRVLGLSLSHGVNFFDPDVIVIGGAIAGAWEHFAPSMMETLHGHIFDKPRAHLKTVLAALGDDAPLYGAVSLVADSHR